MHFLKGRSNKVTEQHNEIVVFIYPVHVLVADDDAHDVYREVLDLAGKWGDMSSSLGLKTSDEEIIAIKYPQNPKRCLREVITKWLQKAYNTCKFGPPTWRTLVKAVLDPAGEITQPSLKEFLKSTK